MLPAVILTAAWLVGLLVAGWFNLSDIWLGGGVVAGSFFALSAFFYNRSKRYTPDFRPLPVLLPLALIFFSLAGWRYQLSLPSADSSNILYYLGQPELSIVGVVSGEPVYGTKSESFRLSVQQIWPEKAARPTPATGEVYVRTSSNYQIKRGDLVQLSGTLLEPEELTGEDFPYKQWLARQGIYTTLSYPRYKLLAAEQDFLLTRWFYNLNSGIRQLLEGLIPGREGAILSGILLGDKKNITADVQDAFRASGITHILVVSGGNISILVMLVTLSLQRFFRKPVVLTIALAVLILYVLLVGLSPAVIRAGLMGGMALIGMLAGREYSGYAGLALAALVISVWQPAVVWDIGFQLSFAATLGILLLAAPLQTRLKKLPPFLAETLAVTLAAQALTLPLLIFYFETVSTVSVLTNLLVVPIIPVIMAFGLLTAALGWIPFVGQGVAGLTWLFLSYILTCATFCAGLPFASLQVGKFHPVWLLVYYVLLGLAFWWFKKGRHNLQLRAVLTAPPLVVGLTGFTGLVWVAVFVF